jgi:hypothetical protein
VHEINHDAGNEVSHDQPMEDVSFCPWIIGKESYSSDTYHVPKFC